MSDVAYPKLSAAEDIFKSVVWDTVVETSLQALFTAVPFLRFWLFAGPIRKLVTWVADKVFALIRLNIDVSAIRFVNARNQNLWDSVSLQLRVIAHDKGIDSPEFLKAREDAKVALSKLGRFGATS